MAKRKPVTTPALPASHLEAISAAGFTTIRYQNTAIAVIDSVGDERREWLPEDLAHWEKRLFVRFRRAGEGSYSFDGWEPINGHQFGGRYPTVAGALGWFDWLDQQKARFGS